MLTSTTENTENKIERASSKKTYIPSVDIYDGEDAVVLYADMPGVSQEGVNIMLEKNILTIDGRTESIEPDTRPLTREFGTGDYHRSFQLNDEFESDNISASIKNGVLKVNLPRVKPAKKNITVTAG